MRRTVDIACAAAAAIALVLAFRNVGITPWELAVSAALLALMFLPAGYLLIRRVGDGVLLSGERHVLAWLAGYAVSSAAYYFLSVIKAAFLFPALALGAACLALAPRLPAMKSAAGRPFRRALETLGSADWPLLALMGLVLWISTFWTAAFIPVKGGVTYNHTPDHLLHLSFYGEMLRGIPPRQLPAAAGMPFPPYHVFAYMPGIILARYGGLEMASVYHAVTTLLHVALFAGALYLAVRVRTGSRATAAASLAAVFFIARMTDFLFRNRLVGGKMNPFGFFLRSVSGAGGMIVWATVFCLLFIGDRERRLGTGKGRRALYLAALLAGLSWFFKAQFFLAFGAAWFLALALLYLRDRDRSLLLAGFITLAVFGLIFVSWRAEHHIGGLVFSPGLFARRFVYPAMRRDPLPFFHGTLLHFFRSFPGGLGWLVATPFGVWRLLHFSPFVLLYLGSLARRARTIGTGDAALGAFFPIILLMALFMGDVGVYGEISGQMFRETANTFPLLTACLDMACLAAVLGRLGLGGGRTALAGALAVSLLLAPVYHKRTSWFDHRRLLVLSPGYQGALRYLRRETPRNAVVVGAMEKPSPKMRRRTWHLNQYPLISGLGGRRSVLEYYYGGIDPRHRRERDIRLLFNTTRERSALKVLDRYRADYLVETNAFPLRFPKQVLSLVYDGGDARVYRRQRR